MATLSERLKDIRKFKGYTQQEMADFLGISKSSLNNYEQGIRKPNIEILELIADKLNYPMEYLMGKYEEINCPICHTTFNPLDKNSVKEHDFKHYKAILKLKSQANHKIEQELNRQYDLVIQLAETDNKFYNLIMDYMSLTTQEKERFYEFWDFFKKMKT